MVGLPASCDHTGIGGTSLITLDANGNGMVVYEVAFADPNALEFANVVVYVNPTVYPQHQSAGGRDARRWV